ncbi:MAG: Ig-like domain-containing protein, partial [Gemmatimonadaceae bacterium]
VGEQTQFTATVNAVNGASTNVNWTSSAPGIATVSATGQVLGVAAGATTITATSAFDATKSAAANLTVNPRSAVVSVAITPAAPSVVVGQSVPLTATVSVVGGASTAVTWGSSNLAIVSVSNTGVITGVTAGSANVTATSVADPTKSAAVLVTVNPPPPAVVSIVVTPANPSVVVGDVAQLVANVTVVSGAATTVTWTTSNATIATVAPNGQVTGVAAGTATITAISTFDTTKRGGVSLTVNPRPAVSSVTVSSPHAALIVGTTAQMTATVAAVGGASTAVVWSSGATGVATISATGVVTAVATGNATITATSVFDGTKQGSISLRVDAAAIVNSVTVAPGTLSLAVGAAGQLAATVSTGNNASQQVTWSSSNAAFATVDQTGKVTAVAAGTATIRATVQADATKFGESVVTVTGASFPSAAEVQAGTDSQFSPATVDLALGGTVTWTFASLTHNVTFAATVGAPANIGNSMNMQVSRTFNTAGTFTYDCTIHGGMTGRIIVH